jgi:stearoyl-CoA desaturase (delta-9 desaturase)
MFTMRRKYMILLYGYLFYYIAAAIGISIGYHRYFSHRTFETHVFFEYIFLFFGLICGGRSLLTWAGVHRMHHMNSDTIHDPHSPTFMGAKKVLLSLWKVKYIPRKHVRDLILNPRVCFFHRYGKYIHIAYAAFILFFGLQALFIFVILPYIFSWIGFGSLNYFAHRNGKPINIPIANIISVSEGWHLNHHNNPSHYRVHKYDFIGKLIEIFKGKQYV